jgi:hypothetical protein
MNKAPPIEERFWKRYSPHHELPLSSATSVTVHVLLIVFMVMSGWLLANFALGGNKVLDLDTIVIAGGGGSRKGVGNERGDQPPVSAQEDVEKQGDLNNPGTRLATTEPLKTPTLDPLNLRPVDHPAARQINQASAAIRAMSKLTEDARKKIFNAIGPGPGLKGPGSDGGEDSGTDIGKDKRSGPGTNNISRHQQRLLRWVMIFNTRSGNDYRKQLLALKAILAFPEANGNYRVYRDLNQRPAKGEIEDLAAIKRLYWIDDKSESIESLSRAMGLKPPNGSIIAFFPDELEAKLLRLELSYRGLKEDEIKETHFKIVDKGGTYEPVVVYQK